VRPEPKSLAKARELLARIAAQLEERSPAGPAKFLREVRFPPDVSIDQDHVVAAVEAPGCAGKRGVLRVG
jgi:hypothetical protein